MEFIYLTLTVFYRSIENDRKRVALESVVFFTFFIQKYIREDPNITICQGNSKIISLYRGIVMLKLPI